MSQQDEIRKKLLNRFKEEADSNLLMLQRRLVDLESDPENKDFLKEVFRAAHTIKGNARMMNFQDISQVAHHMESIFGEMRDNGMRLKPEINDLLFEAADVITQMIEGAVKGEKVNLDTQSLNQQLMDVIKKPEPVASPQVAVQLADAAVPPQPATQAVTPPPTTPTAPTAVAAPAPEPAQPAAQAQPAATPRATLNDNVIQVDVDKLDELMNITGELVLGKKEAEDILDKLRDVQDLIRQRQRLSGPVRNLIASVGRDPSEFTTWQEMRETLTKINEIDQQVDNKVKNILRIQEEHTSELVNRVDELENSVKSVRMLPVDTLYDRYSPPQVRNMARRNGKGKEIAEVRYIGGDIELDKKVLEGISAPMIHIINNSLDHGIELPDERLNARKPRGGIISMSASQDGGYVSIKVTDDGQGINPDKIRNRALEKKIINENAARNMSDEDIIYLIFEPGFSTADIVTDSSGRGVGMDLVKSNVERLGGQVFLNSKVGVGTTVTMRVPVTLATSRALLVRVENHVYAVQAASIESMLYLQPSDIFSREGREMTLYRNSLVPLVRLEDILGGTQTTSHPIFQYLGLNSEKLLPVGVGITAKVATENGGYNGANGNGNGNRDAVMGDGFIGLTLADPRASSRVRELMEQNSNRRARQLTYERLPAVVVGSGDRKVCFIVDELVDETEIVVKNLGPLLSRARHVNSATIMGDGQVVMILDVPSLVRAATNLTRAGLKRKQDRDKKRKRILVVDDSITTRELERSILEAHGHAVELADDGTVALDILGRDTNFDIVVSDVEMPNMNGFELTSRIKGNPITRNIPVIIVSSLYSDEHKRRGIEAGAQAYISKGDFEQDNLLNTIEYLTD